MDTPTTDTITVETVLPRPVDELPAPALAPATRKLADKLIDNFDMSDETATALASATVDPTATRKAIDNPERLYVPGGVLLAVRTDVWSRRVMPDPRNPRVNPARRHPAAGILGNEESTRFRPLPDPVPAPGGRPEMVVTVKNQEHLAWASHQAKTFVLSANDWRESIRNQGVMTEVWLAGVTFDHLEGTSVSVPVSVEGSSRITAVHDILHVRSADVPYTGDDRKFRAHIKRLNEGVGNAGDQVDPAIAVQVRCERVPALLLVGFETHHNSTANFVVAVRSLVALRHVDPPKPWGEATENESLADAVLGELAAREIITAQKAAWLAGALTPEEAAAAQFSSDPTIRAAEIVRLFTDRSSPLHEGVRVAITSQSTRKKITPKLLFDLATSLVMRSVNETEPRKREQLRKYLKDAFGQEVTKDWTATYRSVDEVTADALAELRAGEPGPATRELAARAAYPLVISGRLYGDRGKLNSDQPDRRRPGEVIDRMRSSPRGIEQLRQALNDYGSGRTIRMVDEQGQVMGSSDGHGDAVVRDSELRRLYAPPGQPSPTPAPESPGELLANALAELGTAVGKLDEAVRTVESVRTEDGRPAIISFGADHGDCQAWEGVLFRVLQQLPVWAQAHHHYVGVESTGDELDLDEFDEGEDLDDEWEAENLEEVPG